MERVCFLLQVKRDRLAEYKEIHRHVWPAMQKALRETGWHNYSLFLRDDGLLVGYCESPNFKTAVDGMQNQDVNKRWQAMMAPFFEGIDGQPADQGLLRLVEVFHLE